MILAHLDWQEEASEPLRQMRLRDRAAYPGEQEILDRQPEMTGALAIGLRAWRAASSARSVGFGIGPIPEPVIEAWCDRRGLGLRASDFLGDALRWVDNVVLGREASKRKAKS